MSRFSKYWHTVFHSLNFARGSVNDSRRILQVERHCSRQCKSTRTLSARSLLISRLVFLREFRITGGAEVPAPAASSKPNGTAWKGKAKDKKYTANAPFIPENVYDAMKETKRFESLSVSHAHIWSKGSS